jgi:hypothetical protein
MPKTVDSITSGLTKMVTDLKAHSEAKKRESDSLYSQATDIEFLARHAEDESERADAIAERISSLLGSK